MGRARPTVSRQYEEAKVTECGSFGSGRKWKLETVELNDLQKAELDDLYVEMMDFCKANSARPSMDADAPRLFQTTELYSYDDTPDDVAYSTQYRLFRHIGPFVKRGAHVMEVDGSRDGTRLILFRNPDGKYVLVVACDGTLVRGRQRRRIVIKHNGRYKTLPLPGGQWSVSTLVFK